jgi:hypothetical protein
LQKLYNNKYNITFGDVNVNYLIDNNRKSQLDAVFHYYHISVIVEFPTITDLNSHTAIDNVSFIHQSLQNIIIPSYKWSLRLLLTVTNNK